MRMPSSAAAATLSPGGRPAADDNPSLRAGGSSAHQRRHGRAAGACDASSAQPTGTVVAMLAIALDAQQERQRSGADAVSADAAVAHDVELPLARLAAAETVGGIGKSVFVQTAGREQRRSDASAAAGQAGRPSRCASAIDHRADEADHDAGDRKRPCRLGDGARP